MLPRCSLTSLSQHRLYSLYFVCDLQLLSSAGAILLQREIPEAVNIEVAKVSIVFTLLAVACVVQVCTCATMQ